MVCQSRLHQWSLVFKMYTDGNEGRWFEGRYMNWVKSTFPLWRESPAITLCPVATAVKDPPDAFSAWQPNEPLGRTSSGSVVPGATSYGINDGLCPSHWATCDVEGSANIPVLFDCISMGGFPFDEHGPPECDSVGCYLELKVRGEYPMCINRHGYGINMLFMDWSVQKVGLKRLWTFKWHPGYETSGPWTKTGGVLPEDWPRWMRGFKDY